MTHDSRSTGALGSVGTAGSSFVQSRTFEGLSRAGFVARGLIYGIIGILALKLALGHGGKLTNQQGALHTVAHQPFGKLLLVLVAVGLGGYALWRLVRAAIGHGPEGRDDAFDRVAAFASGIVYAAMCVLAVEILLDARGGSTTTPKKATAGVLGWSHGTWIVGIAGAVLIGVALYQGYRGITKKFLDDSKTGEMGPHVKVAIGWLGTVGHLARMIVFGLVGHLPDQSRGRLQRAGRCRSRRRTRQDRPPPLRAARARPRRRRPCRVRALLADRRPLPQDLADRC